MGPRLMYSARGISPAKASPPRVSMIIFTQSICITVIYFLRSVQQFQFKSARRRTVLSYSRQQSVYFDNSFRDCSTARHNLLRRRNVQMRSCFSKRSSYMFCTLLKRNSYRSDKKKALRAELCPERLKLHKIEQRHLVRLVHTVKRPVIFKQLDERLTDICICL